MTHIRAAFEKNLREFEQIAKQQELVMQMVNKSIGELKGLLEELAPANRSLAPELAARAAASSASRDARMQSRARELEDRARGGASQWL